jgi:2-amino-4-hydroxy-6-hydroxymethyldihydropteridine diphosphokinase
MICYIGIGSNLDDRLANIRQAICHIREAARIKVLRVSPIYETLSEGGPEGQPDYLNLVIEIKTDYPPVELLAVLKEAEKVLGRKPREARWDHREIDFDILVYGDLIVKEQNLIVPHPLMHKRFFVLKPLHDLNPDWEHPVLKADVRTLLSSLDYKERWNQVQ